MNGSTLVDTEKEKSIAVLGLTDTYYVIGTKEKEILADAKVRNIIINSVNISLIEDIDFESLNILRNLSGNSRVLCKN